MAVRMIDIARDLGVSLMTVSKALRGHADISEATRGRVTERALQMGYRPNWLARSLATGRTHLVGLVIPRLSDSFWAEVACAVTQRFARLGYPVVIASSDDDPEKEQRQIELLMTRNVDGLILASVQKNGRGEAFRQLGGRNIPVAQIGRPVARVRSHFVGVRCEDIGGVAAEHLVEQGCRQIACIGTAYPAGDRRLRGCHRALEKHGLRMDARHIVETNHDDGHDFGLMLRLLNSRPRPDGVICFNDQVAGGVIKAALEANYKVPAEIAVIGAGNSAYADLLPIPLSTVDPKSRLTGEKAADLLTESMDAKEDSKRRRILLKPGLIVRQSTRRNAASRAAPA